MMTVLLTGDTMMHPELFQEAIENTFGKDKFDLRIKKYTFNDAGFYLDSGTNIPSGMCLEDPKIKMGYPDCGVNEYYGEPYSLAEDISDVEILIIHGAALPRAVLEKAEKLKYIVSLRGGPANIDMDYVKERGINFYNTNGKNAPAVAEFALGLLLDFERGITYGASKLGENWWWIKAADTYESHEIYGKKFGFVGYGRIAQEFRKRLSGFDIEAYAYSPHVDDELLERDNVKRLSLEELAANCDYITLHTRPVKGKPPVIGEDILKLMQKHAVLINTGRGGLVDHKALKKALEEKAIRGAVLDVLGDESFGFYQDLIAAENTLITPHIAGQSVETCLRACGMCVDILKKIMEEI